MAGDGGLPNACKRCICQLVIAPKDGSFTETQRRLKTSSLEPAEGPMDGVEAHAASP